LHFLDLQRGFAKELARMGVEPCNGKRERKKSSTDNKQKKRKERKGKERKD